MSVLKERTDTPWLTATLVCVLLSVTSARMFQSLSAHRESPVFEAAPSLWMPAFWAALEPKQLMSLSEPGLSSLTFSTRTR